VETGNWKVEIANCRLQNANCNSEDASRLSLKECCEIASPRPKRRRFQSIRFPFVFSFGSSIAVACGMNTQSVQLEERLIEFAVLVLELSTALPKTPVNRHICSQIMRSATAPASNYAEARAAESRADFVHKLGIVHKELNETSVWLRILLRNVAEKKEKISGILAENAELARIIAASLKTAKAN
jgi:four helix bundle protein